MFQGLTHPIGFIETQVTGTELQYALRSKERCDVKVISLDWAIRFEASSIPFKKYVHEHSVFMIRENKLRKMIILLFLR